jgi:ParB-like chromosome segregation protein Spo0J
MIIESLQSLAVPIESLRGLPGNPRRGDVDAVAASLTRFGQRKPIVVRKDDGTIIAGNHTWQAAKKLGWTEIAVAFVGDDDVTAKAFALADNRTAELGSYDEQALLDLIEEVHAVVPEFVRDAGWSDDAVAELVAKIESEQPPKEIDEDEIPEPPIEPVIAPM